MNKWVLHVARQFGQTNEQERTLRHGEMDGVQFLERPGSGPVCVFLHGIGSSSESFRPLFEAFPAGPRLIAWNAPGYLASNPLAAARPLADDYAVVLERFLDSLALKAVTIIGHSLGTLIGSAFALRAPDRVTFLVLAASAQGYGIGAGDALPLKAADRLKDLAQRGPAAFAEARAPRLVFDPESNPSVVARVQREMARINPEGYGQAVHMLATGDLAASVAQLRQKPGFIVGAGDRITPFDQTDAAMRAWAAAHGTPPRCISIPEAGHAVYVQAPEAFCDALFELVPDLQTSTPRHAEGELYGG